MTSRSSASPPELGALFLGPKAENAAAFERLLLEAFRDHVFWRRNFHPEDGLLIREGEQRSPAYQETLARLSEELMGLLGELKEDVPFFSPRYIGHMCSDLAMAGLIGYFAALLYNPNNVSAEASPVTTRLELDVADGLGRMLGYEPDRLWGHLTSGGTIANFEALWLARAVKYLPVALHWACADARLTSVEIAVGAHGPKRIGSASLWELLNVTPGAALDALEAFRAQVGSRSRAEALLSRHSFAQLGAQEFGRRLAAEFDDALPSAVVLVPSTAHYSWEKICRTLGIGAAQLLHVDVDDRFRMSPEALRSTLETLARKRQPVLACVSVVGSTEESAVDRLDRIAEIRERALRELGMAFHLHADAAWGGYAAAITRAPDGRRRQHSEVVRAGMSWPDEGTFKALVALERTDSATIDPHKLGFVPYPAGAVCFADRRGRELLSVHAPYVFPEGTSEAQGLGRFAMEGSRPGAAAAAVWLTHRVLPLDETGYGRLVTAGAEGARALHRRLSEGEWGPFRMVPLPIPDINLVCFAPVHPRLRTLEEANAFVSRIHRQMSAGPGHSARKLDYVLTETTLRLEEYGHAIDGLVHRLGFSREELEQCGGVTVLRCTVMNPFFASGRGKVDFLEGFAASLMAVMEQVLETR